MRFYIKANNTEAQNSSYSSKRREANHLALLHIRQISKRISYIKNVIAQDHNEARRSNTNAYILENLTRRLDYLHEKLDVCNKLLKILHDNTTDNEENSQFISLVMTYLDNDFINAN